MSTAQVGQHVQMEGRDGIFVVLRVDHERDSADLLKIGSVRRIESGVPLARLRQATPDDERRVSNG